MRFYPLDTCQENWTFTKNKVVILQFLLLQYGRYLVLKGDFPTLLSSELCSVLHFLHYGVSRNGARANDRLARCLKARATAAASLLLRTPLVARAVEDSVAFGH